MATTVVSPYCLLLARSWQNYLKRIKIIAEKVLPESQCGFRPGRSTTDTIFTLSQLQEKAIEQQQALYVVFVDFAKAFDTVDRDTLWNVLELYGCPEKIVKIIKCFHEGMYGKVSIGGDMSDTFKINHGVKQGCVLAPLSSHCTWQQFWKQWEPASVKECILGQGLMASSLILQDSRLLRRQGKCA